MRLAIIIIGAASLAACNPSGGNGQAQEDSGVTIELPPEPTPPPAAAAVQEQAPPAPEAEPKEEEKPAEAEAAPKQAPPKEEPPAAKAEEPPPREEEPEPSPTEAPRAEDGPPLPNATIARTIDRIGYRCGNVVSAAPAERNAEGQAVYRIACSSGETYRGTNRNGRMVFRPWEGRARPR